MSQPASIVIGHESLTAIVDVIAPRCDAIARTLEEGGAVDATVLGYSRDLATGTQLLLSALPTAVAKDLRQMPGRLHTALDTLDEQRAAA